jgi:hypothetical protein
MKQRIANSIDKFINENKESNELTELLLELEENVRKDLKISSADPVYDNSDIRTQYITKIENGLKNLDLEKIKKNSRAIVNELINEGSFLLLSLLIMKDYLKDTGYNKILQFAINDPNDSRHEYAKELSKK